jgi:hypothetical protein
MTPSSTLRALVVTALLAAPGAALAEDARPVIGPGQEALLADLLGKGASLPGGCAWAGAGVEPTRVVSSYTCAGGPVAIELHHPTDAPPDAVRTLRFAIQIQPASPPPPGLVDALAARIRAGESAFVWRGGSDDLARRADPEAPLVQQRAPVLRGLGVALAVAAITAALMRWIYRRLERISAPAATLSPRAALGASALAILVSTGLAAAAHGAARAFGGATLASLDRGAGVPIVASAVTMLAYVALALGAAALLARIPTRLPTWARFAAGPVLYLLIGYPLSLTRGSTGAPAFGAIVAGCPGCIWVEHRRDRPPVTYRTSPLGFREPGWATEKARDTRRVALIGDSYVFGVGVELGDTLSSALEAELSRRSPGRRVEIVNLGVPGSNLSSYIDVYAEAADRLALDRVVVCLTLPNDLSRWDSQVARRASGRFGAFSAARFVVGDGVATFWDVALLEHAFTPAGLAHLDEELSRLTALRAAAERRPELYFYAFGDLPAVVRARLEAVPGARVVPPGQTLPDDFLPRDGHPTGEGNRRSARRIADVLEGG